MNCRPYSAGLSVLASLTATLVIGSMMLESVSRVVAFELRSLKLVDAPRKKKVKMDTIPCGILCKDLIL